MISWLPAGPEYTGYNLAANDVNGNSMILPDTFVDYSFVAHYLNPAVCLTSIIFVIFSYSIFRLLWKLSLNTVIKMKLL